MKQALKTDINLSKLKDYSDQNYLISKGSEINNPSNIQRKSLQFRTSSKNSGASNNKSIVNEENQMNQSHFISKDKTSGWGVSTSLNQPSQHPADEVNYNQENMVESHA